MSRVVNTRTNNILIFELERAQTLWSRMKGLIGRKTFEAGSGLLIPRCGNSIHTCFMKFPIDVVFADKKGVVKHITKNVKPWRLVFAPVFLNTDVFEMPAGAIQKSGTQVGDTLRVEN